MDSSIGGERSDQEKQKKGRAVSTKDLPFRQKRQTFAIKIKRWKKGGPVSRGGIVDFGFLGSQGSASSDCGGGGGRGEDIARSEQQLVVRFRHE